jgi:hypothetical protein
MLKVHKRNRDFEMMETTNEPQCSPLKVSSSANSSSFLSPKSKQEPFFDTTPKKVKAKEVQETTLSKYYETPFVANTQLETDNLTDFLGKKSKPKPKEKEEVLFTYDQVKEIVNRAVAEREAQLRVEYDMILNERLQEQFRNFTKFNEDYISRQLKQSDFSYLS